MNPKILYIATGNAHKLGEFSEMFKDLPIKIQGISHLDSYDTPEETGTTFAQNAHIKADSLFQHLTKIKIPFDFVLADDSGLVCDDLNGEPGVHSARFAGIGATASQNNKKLIDEFKKITQVTRAAHFACVLCLFDQNGNSKQFEGRCDGLITLDPKGGHGFGYDPLFYLPEFNQSMAELAPEIKNRISHRARAFQALLVHLKQNTGDF